MTPEEFFGQVTKAAVAFSGGTDSAFLLWLAAKHGCDIRAYYVKTAFQPEFEYEDAVRMAKELKVPMHVIPVDILAVPEAAANGPDRCYYCKKALFTALRQAAGADGYEVLLDGTNASDDAGDRPGMKALRELEVRSPLKECGITKYEVRKWSRDAGLFTWKKPAYACLATRVPEGTEIREEMLHRIEKGEQLLAGMGFSDMRLRLYGEGARIQVREEQMPLVMQRRREIAGQLKELFPAVLLDLEPRAKQNEGIRMTDREKETGK